MEALREIHNIKGNQIILKFQWVSKWGEIAIKVITIKYLNLNNAVVKSKFKW